MAKPRSSSKAQEVGPGYEARVYKVDQQYRDSSDAEANQFDRWIRGPRATAP